MPELTEARITQICQNAAVNAVEEFDRVHPCMLTEEDRGNIHALSDAIRDEKANHGTLRIIVQIGKSYQDITGSLRKFGMFIILLLVLLFGIKHAPDLARFWR
jgi:hypothetical protein